MPSLDLRTTALAVVLVLAIQALAWTMLASLTKVARRPAWAMAAANLSLACGAFLTMGRADFPGYLSYHGAAVFLVSGITAWRLALMPRVPQGFALIDLFLIPLFAFGALLFVPPQPPYLPKLQWVMSLAFFVTLMRIVVEIRKPLTSEFGVRAAWLALTPFMLFALLEASARALPLTLYFLAGQHGEPSLANVNYLTGVLAAIFIINGALIGIVLSRLLRKVRQLSEHDVLTGIMNRRALELRLRSERSRLARTGQPFAVILFDLDHFKQVNDTRGHAVGDAVLRHAALTIGATLREQDLFGRYGGEEFVVILPATLHAGASEVAERMRRELACTPVPGIVPPLAVAASFGIAVVRTAEESDEQIYKRADDALYRAKEGGRNRVEMAPDSMPPSR
jgi:diguanylate cyclase (GGDEF)-like protein